MHITIKSNLENIFLRNPWKGGDGIRRWSGFFIHFFFRYAQCLIQHFLRPTCSDSQSPTGQQPVSDRRQPFANNHNVRKKYPKFFVYVVFSKFWQPEWLAIIYKNLWQQFSTHMSPTNCCQTSTTDYCICVTNPSDETQAEPEKTMRSYSRIFYNYLFFSLYLNPNISKHRWNSYHRLYWHDAPRPDRPDFPD